MPADDFADTTGELDVSVAGLVGAALDDLHVVVTISPRGGDAEEIESLLATLSYQDPIRWEAQATYRGWITDLARDERGTVYQVDLDGNLRVGYGDSGRRLALPARRGLTSAWVCSPSELLVCGPGALGHVRLAPGRTIADFLDDDGPGEARVVAGPPGARHPSGAIAVGTRGALWQKDDDGWTAHETAAVETLMDVAWQDGERAYVVGADGGVFLWDGGALREIARADVTWRSAACWRGALYLAGGPEGVFRLDGTTLVPVKALPLYHLRVVADHLFGWGGSLVVRHDGDAWWGGPLNVP